MANNHLRPHPLPPGVYFSPTREECLGFLDRWIAGDKKMPDARGCIFFDDVYRDKPDKLRREYTPSSSRAGEHSWWFLGEARFQSKTAGSRCNRADRSVTTGGYWQMQGTGARKKVPDEAGIEKGFKFFLDSSSGKKKTPWLMEEFTTAKDNSAGKKVFPALGRVYVTPRATVDELREIYGEDGVPVRPDGKKKPAAVRAKVPAAYLKDIAARLTSPAPRHADQHQVAPPPPPPPPGQDSPVGVLGQDLQQRRAFLEADAPGQQRKGFVRGGRSAAASACTARPPRRGRR